VLAKNASAGRQSPAWPRTFIVNESGGAPGVRRWKKRRKSNEEEEPAFDVKKNIKQKINVKKTKF
jgi:hypothetical protein